MTMEDEKARWAYAALKRGLGSVAVKMPYLIEHLEQSRGLIQDLADPAMPESKGDIIDFLNAKMAQAAGISSAEINNWRTRLEKIAVATDERKIR